LMLPTPTKILKAENKQTSGENHGQNHKAIIDHFLKLCLFMKVLDAKKQIEEFQSKSQVNPQQDDFEEITNSNVLPDRPMNGQYPQPGEATGSVSFHNSYSNPRPLNS
jgi:hypothetical protein